MSTKITIKPKQAEVVKRIIKGESATQAYMGVYAVKNSDVAGASASRMLGSVRVRDAFQNMLVGSGMGLEVAVDAMRRLNEQRDWRATDAFLKHITSFFDLGPQKDGGGQPVAQVGNIVNNWMAEKK